MKMEKCDVLKLPEMGGEGIKGMVEGVNSTMIYCKNFVNVTMCSQYNNNKKWVSL
jgi:hypothetical protein